MLSPAYRLPMKGYELSLPSLLRDGATKVEDVRAVTDFYLAAEEMNRCLDSANDIAMGEGHSGEVRESLLL